MSGENATANAGATSYADLRQRRRDDPGFLSAKEYPNGADITVTGTGTGKNSADAKFRPGEEYNYWVVDVKDGVSGAKIRETATMMDKLDDLGIENPAGHTFLMTTIPVQSNPNARQWVIARDL